MMTTIDGVQYREVARKAQVGEKIKIVDADSPFRTYKDGDVFTVKSVFTDECCVKEHGTIVFHSEYVVLEPVAPADIIVHDGKQYRKVDRPVREGDALVIPKLRRYTIDLTSGKVYALGRDSAGGAYFYDDVEDARYNPIRENDVYVLEPVAPQTAQSALSALETELAATKAKVAEMEAQLAAARDAAFDQFSAGEKVRLVSGGGAYPLLGFENGRVYTVRNPKHTGRSDGTKVQLVTDYGKVGFANPDQLVKAIEEAQPLKVGDYAKVVEPTAGFSAKGQIVKITEVDDSDIPYNTQGMDGEYTGWHEATDLVRATDEEVAEAKRKAEEKRRLHELEAKWHAIGREVGEFKKGDVVRIVPKNVIGKVEDVGTSLLGICDYSGKYYGPGKECVELIAPVESVVNLFAS